MDQEQLEKKNKIINEVKKIQVQNVDHMYEQFRNNQNKQVQERIEQLNRPKVRTTAGHFTIGKRTT